MKLINYQDGGFYNADCFDAMRLLPDGCVDMILCDLPYGTTDCKWDAIIPFEPLWKEYWRLIKPNGAVVLTAAQPFTSALVMSQAQNYKTSWVWNKKQSGGFATAKYHPLKITEDVLVFGRKTVTYNPEMRKGVMRKKGGAKTKNEIQSGLRIGHSTMSDSYYPTNIIDIVSPRGGDHWHPTQKPVALFEYLIRTYTNPGEIVLDNTAGSGTTAVAARNTGRRWICIERDETYFNAANARLV